MGYIKTDLFTLPSDPAYQVRMKQQMPTGDWLAAVDYWRNYGLPAEDDPGRSLAEQRRQLDATRLVVARSIVDWNLTDANDSPLPVTVESLDVLNREDFAFLREKAEAQMAGRPAEAEGPFVNSSGRRSRATKSKRRQS